MTDKEILKGFSEHFQTGRLFSESNVLVLMSYARGDALKMLKEKLPTEEDIETEIIEGCYNGNPEIRRGIRMGARLVVDMINKLI
jgi:hypothetical protein